MEPVVYKKGMKYPLRALIFLISLGLFGIFCLYSVPWNSGFPLFSWFPVAVWCFMGSLSESSSIHLPKGNIQISSTEAIFCASYLIFGLIPTLFVISSATFIYLSHKTEGLKHVFNTPFRLTFFNFFHYILILWVIDILYRVLKGVPGTVVFLPSLIKIGRAHV